MKKILFSLCLYSFCAVLTANPGPTAPVLPEPSKTTVVSTPATSPSLPKTGISSTPPALPQTVNPSAPAVPTAHIPSKPTLSKLSSSATSASSIIPVPPALEVKGYLLIDANSGYIIAQKNQDQTMAPASLTKLMSMYVASAAIKEGRIHLNDMVPISENAWRTGGSRMFVKVGTQVSVQDLSNGIIVASGNDACVAMAEFVAGSESSFVDLMNKMAAELGMQHTHYADATGLPNPANYTTPYDLSILARAIIFHYPEDYKWYSQKWMFYNKIKQPNRNLLLFRDPTVDGLKTGHTDDAGFCLVASAKRNNDMRLIAIVMGANSSHQRADYAEALLNYGYRFFETHQLYAADKPVSTQRIWFGQEKETALGLAEPMYITIPVGQYTQMKASFSVNPKLEAPISRGQKLGEIQVTLGGKIIATQPLVALADNPLGGFFSRLGDHISMWFH